MRLEGDGRFIREVTHDDGACVTRGRYEVRSDEEGYGSVELEWKVDEHCGAPGSPGWVDTINRISNDLFVIIDGSTGAVSAFRRVP